MQRSDETGDGPGSLGSAVVPPADAAANNLPTQVLRERIRRAGAASTATELAGVDLAPELATRSSMPPEHSGVRARPDEPAPAAVLPPPVFLAPPTAAGSKSTPPRSWPFDPKNKPAGRGALASTQVGLGGPVAAASLRPAPAPLGLGRAPDKARSHTPPLPAAVFFGAAQAPAAPVDGAPARAHAQKREQQPANRAAPQRAPTEARPGADHSPGAYSVTQPVAAESVGAWSPSQRAAALRQSEAHSGAGRYSAHDLSVEHIEQSPAPADAALLDDSNARARRFTPKQRPAHRRGRDPNRITGPGRFREDRSDIVQTLPDRPAVHSTLPGRGAMVRSGSASDAAARGGVAPGSHALSGGVSGALSGYGAHTVPGQAATPSTYEPLPRDRAGFEAFMRERAASSGAPGARPNWKEQETLLLPRSALPMQSDEQRGLLDRVHWRSFGAVLALLFIGGMTFWFRTQASQAGNNVRAVPIAAAAAASTTSTPQDPMLARTVIATEPSGAELLLAGAVLGNTPVEVARPEQGEETYLLRMRGFESQLVRVTPQTSEAMRVTLLPLGGEAPSPLPAATRAEP